MFFFNNNAFVEGRKLLNIKGGTTHLERESHSSQAAIPSASNDSIWNDFDTEVRSFVISRNLTAAFIVELEKYLLEPLIP